MKDYKINNIFDINKDDIRTLQEDLENHKIIPEANKKLKEKLNLIISYTAFNNNISMDYDEDSYKDINPTDYNLIKNYLLSYSEQSKTKYFIDEKIIKKEIKLTLRNLFQEFLNQHKDLKNDDTEIVSLKIYDYYRDGAEKDESLDELNQILSTKTIKNLNIVSNINTMKTYNFYKDLLLKDSNSPVIKYMYKENNQHSYISSIFYMLFKFRIGTNYKLYYVYLEPNVNWGIATYTSKNDFSSYFFNLLESRFEKSFNHKYTIEFNNNNNFKNLSFNEDLESIISDINSLLDTENPCEDDIFKKIASLKLKYPKIDLAYKLIKNVAKNIILAKEIEYTKSKGGKLPNTERVINLMEKEKILFKINRIYHEISYNKDLKIDIFKLRKSIFINIFSNNQAICDVFENLKWSNQDEILTSLDDIYYSKNLLGKFFKCLNKENIFSFKEKQIHFEKIVEKYIVKGLPIPKDFLASGKK